MATALVAGGACALGGTGEHSCMAEGVVVESI